MMRTPRKDNEWSILYRSGVMHVHGSVLDQAGRGNTAVGQGGQGRLAAGTSIYLCPGWEMYSILLL